MTMEGVWGVHVRCELTVPSQRTRCRDVGAGRGSCFLTAASCAAQGATAGKESRRRRTGVGGKKEEVALIEKRGK